LDLIIPSRQRPLHATLLSPHSGIRLSEKQYYRETMEFMEKVEGKVTCFFSMNSMASL
jgi:hypothetical protein